MQRKIFKKMTASLMTFLIFGCYMFPSVASVNDETIYSNLDVNGEVYKTYAGITKEDKNGTNIQKNEIQEELPIECEVVYKLDGYEMPVNDIIGKKGRVTIELKYINKDEKQAWVNGQNEKMYTPFLVVSGMYMDSKQNKNIEVNHGKIINNGEKTIVVGFAVPGLMDSLKLDDYNIDVCDMIDISFDTESFELNNIMTYATPKVFETLNIKMSDFDELFGKVSKLQNASNEIEEGAEKLNNGIITLNAGALELKNGSESLDEGVGAIKKGANSLNDGAIALSNGINEYSTQSTRFNEGVTQISKGANELNQQYVMLNDGINDLNNGSIELKNGAQRLSDGTTLLANGTKELSENVGNMANSVKKLDDGTKSISEGINALTNSVKSQKDELDNAGVPQAILDNRNLIEELQDANIELEASLEVADDSLKDIITNQINMNNKTIEKLTASNNYIMNVGSKSKENITDLCNSLISLKEGIDEVSGGMELLSSGVGKLSEGTASLASSSSDLAEGAVNVSAGANQLSDGTGNLVSGSKQVSKGLNTLSSGANNLSSAGEKLNDATSRISIGAGQLQSGTNDLAKGADDLADGTKALVKGIDSLSDGSQKLSDGSTELLDGIKTFNNQGIDKFCDLVNHKGKSLIRRVEILEKLSRDYSTFSSDEKRENIQFISIMDSMGKADVKTSKKE